MPKSVTEIPQVKRDTPIWAQQLRVAAYCRVSTKHEEQQKSLNAQIDYYTNYIQSHPNWVLAAVYSGTASGTRTNQRPGYQQLMRDCANKKVDLILVKSLSRFGRDALETICQIRRLKKMNIGEKNVGQLDTYLVESAHEPIIDRETFDLVQRIKGRIKKKEENLCSKTIR